MARIIVFVIFGGFGLVMLYVGVTQFIQQRRLLANARVIDALIVHSEVFVSKSEDTDSDGNNSTTTYRPDVRFSYQLAGANYESDLLYPNIIAKTYASREGASEELKPFPPKAKVKAFVDPSQPAKGFLVAQAGAGPLVFLILGIVLPPLAWFAGRFV